MILISGQPVRVECRCSGDGGCDSHVLSLPRSRLSVRNRRFHATCDDRLDHKLVDIITTDARGYRVCVKKKKKTIHR